MRGLGRAKPRLRVAAKFFLVLAVVVPAITTLGWIGLRGLADMKLEVSQLYHDHLVTSQLTARVAADLHRASELSLQLLVTRTGNRRRRLEHELHTELLPRVESDIDGLRRAHAGDPPRERAAVELIARQWHTFQSLHETNHRQPVDSQRAVERRAKTIEAIFGSASTKADEMIALEGASADRADARADHTYARVHDLLLETGAAILLAVAGVVLLLIRNFVPRVRAYSGFAARVARGELDQRLRPGGHDELTDLGVTLNDIVDRQAAERDYEHAQAELSQGLQVTESEEEAHRLLKRHLERSVAGSTVVVLNRNNSADRLVATTMLPADSELDAALADTRPGSCMAVRLGAGHERKNDREQLLDCQVCGSTPRRSTCEPLLVGGEVIGSVLVQHPDELSAWELNQVKSSVAQAAPVLANLRNLAIAEVRAATDALTGLPNRRAAEDTLKRMVAHASRTMSPLSAILLDLDHFKQINDVYGHGSGDEVLAAVGSVLHAAVRGSDFAARSGGEEFMILLASTSRDGAEIAAERIRVAIAGIKVPQVERPITASLGVAVMPDHAVDGTALLRLADRALYEAKALGRDRAAIFDPETTKVSQEDPGELAAAGHEDGMAH